MALLHERGLIFLALACTVGTVLVYTMSILSMPPCIFLYFIFPAQFLSPHHTNPLAQNSPIVPAFCRGEFYINANLNSEEITEFDISAIIKVIHEARRSGSQFRLVDSWLKLFNTQ